MIPTYVFGWPTSEELGNFLAVDLGESLCLLRHHVSPTHPTIKSISGRGPPVRLNWLPLGGTNLRVCLVTLEGKGKFEITQAKYRLSEEQKQDEGQKLFDFCGECLKAFVDANHESGLIPKGSVLPLGFTVGVALPSYHDVILTDLPVLLPLRVRCPEFLPFLWLTRWYRQDRIDHGVLIRWTKGFGASNTEGHDVVEMFRKSLAKHVRDPPPHHPRHRA